MRNILVDLLHVFVILMMASFFIFGIMAINGKFDHWTTRFVHKTKHIFSRIRRYFLRQRKRGLVDEDGSPLHRPLHHHHPEIEKDNAA